MRQTVKRATLHDVLRAAMDLEQRSMDLYTAFVTHHAGDPELHRFWLGMARHEAGHYGALAMVECMIRRAPEVEIGNKVWFEEATVVRLRALLQAYLREARDPVSADRAFEMAIDIEGSELEDLVIDLMEVVPDPAWRRQATQFLIHDLGDLAHVVERRSSDEGLHARAEALLDRRLDAVRSRRRLASASPAEPPEGPEAEPEPPPPAAGIEEPRRRRRGRGQASRSRR